MAEEIRIDRDQAESWAREATLVQLTIASRKSADYLRKIAEKSGSAKDELDRLDRIAEQVSRSTRETSRDLDELGSGFERNIGRLGSTLSTDLRDFSSSMERLGTTGGFLGELQRSAEAASDTLGSSTGKMGRVLGGFVTVASKALGAVALVSQGLTTVFEINDQFNTLFKSGVNFDKGLRGLSDAASDLGITTSELVQSFTKYSASVTFLGTTRTTQLAKQFKNLTLNAGELGLSLPEATDALLEYTELQRLNGSLSTMSNDQLVAGTKGYVQQLNELSAVTGKSKDELKKEQMERAKNSRLQVALSGLDADTRRTVMENLQKGSELLGGGEAGKIFEEAIRAQYARGAGNFSLLSKEMQLLINNVPGLRESLTTSFNDMQNNGGKLSAYSTRQVSESMSNLGDFASQLRQLDPESTMGKVGIMAVEAGLANRNVAELQKEVAQIIKDRNLDINDMATLEKVTREVMVKRGMATNADFTESQNKLKEAASKLQGAFNSLMVEAVQPLLPTINTLAGGVTKVAEDIRTVMDGTKEMITEATAWLKDKLSFIPFFGSDEGGTGDGGGAGDAGGTGFLGGLGAEDAVRYGIEGIIGYYLGKKLFKGGRAIKNIFTRSTGGGLPPMPDAPGGLPNMPNVPGGGAGGAGGAGAAGRTGGMFSNLTGGLRTTMANLGGVIKDGITGISGTLRTVATDMVKVIGDMGTSLGQAIRGLGSGLGGALQGLLKGIGGGVGVAIGAILQGLATGMKAFTGALPGAAALAASIVLIGGAVDLVAAGFGAALYVIGKGMESVADGMHQFDDVDGDNLGKVGAGMISLGAGLAAMGAGSVVNSLSSLGSSILNFFTGGDPIEQLKRFGELGEPLSNASKAMDLFSTSFKKAVEVLNASPVSDVVKATMSNIREFLEMDLSGFFGGDPPIIAQVNALSEAIRNLGDSSMSLGGGGGTAGAAPALSPSEMQTRMIEHYDNQKQSNARTIELLSALNDKVITLNQDVRSQTDSIVRQLRSNSPNL